MSDAEIVRAELAVDVPDPDLYREWLHRWFDGALRRLAADQLATYEGSAKPADVRIGLLLASPKLGGRTQNRQFSVKNLDWLCEGAVAERTATCAVSLLDEQGYATESVVRAGVWRSDYDKRWANFDLTYWLAPGDGKQERLLTVLRELAEVCNPVFGYVGFGGGGTRTEFEDAMRCTGLDESYPTARRYLRGYDWVTVIPAELVERLGGIATLQASGAFVEVAALSGGGAWLRATEDFFDYDHDRAVPVFRAVAKVLPPGLPRLPPRLGVQHPHTPVVLEDAAAYGAA